ncbi:hypothetical protein D3C86_1469470 [compost metagenome]
MGVVDMPEIPIKVIGVFAYWIDQNNTAIFRYGLHLKCLPIIKSGIIFVKAVFGNLYLVAFGKIDFLFGEYVKSF